MVEAQSRVRLSLLVVALVAVATVSVVVDRRELQAGARELPLWAAPVLDVAVPVQKFLAMPVTAARDTWSRYVALVGVEQENGVLRSELDRLAEENLQLREALVQSGRLEHIAEIRDDFEVPLLPAELVGSDVSPWFRSVLLDRGYQDGVRSGMSVVSDSGALVGLVTATSRRAAKAMLLLDRQTAIDGTVQRTRARGVVRGRGGDELEFEFVARGGDVQVGDVIMSSGLDGVHPKGLFVGLVVGLSPPGSQLLRTATVAPAVDFGRLEQAFVMLRRSPTMELLYRGGGETAGATETAGAPTP